jgi:hypothetical protein
MGSSPFFPYASTYTHSRVFCRLNGITLPIAPVLRGIVLYGNFLGFRLLGKQRNKTLGMPTPRISLNIGQLVVVLRILAVDLTASKRHIETFTRQEKKDASLL